MTVALDFFLGGTGAGLIGVYVLAAGLMFDQMTESFYPLFIGLALLVMGLAILMADLGRPTNFWRMVKGYRTSWMARGSILNLALLGSSALLILGLSLRNASLASVAADAALLAAALVATYPGLLLFSVRDIRLWRSPLIAILMPAYSTSSGLALLQLAGLSPSHATGSLMPELVWVATATTAVLSYAFFSNSRTSSKGGREGYRLMTSGWLRRPFLLGFVAVGIVSTLLFEAGAILGTAMAVQYGVMGSLSCLAGAFFFRYLTLKAAFHEPIRVFLEPAGS